MIGAGASIATQGKFGEALKSVLREFKPKRILESGTFDGTGSTTLIAGVMPKEAEFWTIEVCPALAQNAKMLDLQKQFGLMHDVHICRGLSVPRSILPPKLTILEDCMEARKEGMDVDPNPGNEIEFYSGEIGYPGPDDYIGHVLRHYTYAPDFVLLDSAGHLGFYEFLYLMGLMVRPFVLALDDIKHLKHWRSWNWIKNDPRFKVLAWDKEERHGFCIAHWDPKRN